MSHRIRLPEMARWIATVLPCMLVCVLAVAVPVKTAQAQDACSSGNFSVSPCVDVETHVSSGGTAEFTIYNYAYGEDAYYARPQCSGIVVSCNGGGYAYVDANSVAIVDIHFSVNQQSGTGTVGADITGNQFGGEVDAREKVYGQPLLTIDSAQTLVSGADQNVTRCAVNCFTASTSISTVPFFTLGQARSLTLVYKEDRAHPNPFIYATVSPAADGPQVSRYYLSATLNGAPVTFTNGESTLNFLSPANQPVRLGGQVALHPGSTALYTLTVNVVVQYTDGSTAPVAYSTILAVYDAGSSSIARGWTIAQRQHLDCRWAEGCAIVGGDGSLMVFPNSSSHVAADHSILQYDGSLQRYVRRYLDQSTVTFDKDGFMIAMTDPVGRSTSFVYDAGGRLTDVIDPRRAAGAQVPYYHLDYNANGLLAIRETGGMGPDRVTAVSVDADGSRNLHHVTDPDGGVTSIYYYPTQQLGWTIDRLGQQTTYGYDVLGKVGSVTAPAIAIDGGTTSSPATYYASWQSAGVPTGLTAALRLMRCSLRM